jgi:hypothetical protein
MREVRPPYTMPDIAAMSLCPRLETAMPRYLVSLALVASLLALSACCGAEGMCNGSGHWFYAPVPFVSHVP